MSQRRARSMKLFCNIDTAAVASIMIVLAFTVLFAFWLAPAHHGASVDLPRVIHPVSMKGASREDALLITITRNGSVYVGTDVVSSPAELTSRILDHLKDRSAERKAYIVSDGRGRYGNVKQVLECVHSAGIVRVGFLVGQRSSPIPAR